MTAAPTADLLAELTSTGDAVRGKGWVSGDLGGGGGDLGQLAATDSPLSALSDAGFDNVRQLVSFLEDPLHQLAGDPGSISSAAQGFQGTGNQLAALSQSYRTSVTAQTTSWSGTAADAYRGAGANQADEIAAIGQAASTVGSAISGAGGAVAQTAQGIRQDITDATGQMLPILTQARAQAAATHGASLAAAIPQCVRIAESYGQRIAARMRALLSSGQNLNGFLEKAMQGIESLKQAFHPQTAGPTTGQQPQGQSNPGPGKTGSGPTSGQQSTQQSGQQSGANPTGSATGVSNQTSSAPTSSAQTAQSGYTDSAAAPTTSDSTGTGVDGGTSGSTDPTSLGGTSVSSAVTPPSLNGGTSVAGGPGTRLGGPGNYATSGAMPSGALPGLSGSGAVSEVGRSAAATEAAAASASGASERPMIGSPMGARGGKGEDDKEHRSPEWLREESGLFDPDEPVTPEVIDASSIPEYEDDEVPPRRLVTAERVKPAIVATALPDKEKEEAEPVKMTWRMSEDGELEQVPAPKGT